LAGFVCLDATLVVGLKTEAALYQAKPAGRAQIKNGAFFIFNSF
jgi:hypothetical protein